MITFTIITCTYNAARELPRTLNSVLEQTYADVEHLIVDGASKDNSLQLLEDYKTNSDASDNGHCVRIISEPDKGLYDAMNKALRLATGDYVLFLNAGDVFHTAKTLSVVADAGEQCDVLPAVIYGHTNVVDEEGNFIRRRRLEPPVSLTWKSFKKGMLVCHQAFFAARKLTESCEYDMQYRFSADFDWCIRLMKMAEQKRMPLVNTNIVVADFLDGGMTSKNHRKSLWERFNIMSKHYGLFSTVCYHAYFVVRSVFKK